MCITLKKALKEINSNNYSIIKILGSIELTLFYNNIKAFMDNDTFCLCKSNNHCIKINKHQIMKILKEADMIIVELDNFLKLNILQNKNIL